MGESLCDRFELEGFEVDWYRTGEAAMPVIGRKEYAVAIGDIRLPDISGADLFARLREQGDRLPPFIFITGFGAIDQAVELLKLGAADYIPKPFDLDVLVEKVHALASAGTRAPEALASTLGISPAMRRIADMLPRLAQHAGILLITGESGVGKEHVAVALHHLAAASSDAPFVAVNCGAFSETLLETELFGHEKGAFTGAVRARKGVFEQAHGGTLFLDEVAEMPAAMQVKLLRAIQDRRIVRVGGEGAVPVQVRLILATHRDLKQMVEQGAFREDLYYRINIINVKVPPLRERREDILWFAEGFVASCNRRMGARRRIHPGARQALVDYPWPGNIRELMHCVERACILAQGELLEVDGFFEKELLASASVLRTESLSEHLDACERAYIRSMLALEQGKIGRTAVRLGISRKNLWEKVKKLGIQEA